MCYSLVYFKVVYLDGTFRSIGARLTFRTQAQQGGGGECSTQQNLRHLDEFHLKHRERLLGFIHNPIHVS